MRCNTVSEGFRHAFALMLAALISTPAGWAQESREFSRWAQVDLVHDDNLFRLSGEDEARQVLGDDDMDVVILRYGAGFDLELPIRRQLLRASLGMTRNQYDSHDFLDHTELQGRGDWHWMLGRLWNGRAFAGYRRDISPFEDFERPVRDTRTTRELGIEARRRLTLQQELALHWTRRETEHDFAPRQIVDRDIDLFAAELLHRGQSSERSWISMRAQMRDVSYPRTETVEDIQIDNSHDEYELTINFNWNATARSSLDGRAGYARVRHDELTERDFSGGVAALRFRYRIGPRLGVDTSLWRDLNARTNTSASYVISDGIMLRPYWEIGSAMTLEGSLMREDRRFEGDAQIAASADVREDTIDMAELALLWDPPGILSAHASWRLERLDSTRNAQDYRYQTFSAGVRVTF
ncbi:MAG: hypothetical protein RBT81_06550 [Gammaproteobacteria bacterium]|jgi:hypothetical protein|nr:hypothetical protein [Gammaproteobacteria bacterium]